MTEKFFPLETINSFGIPEMHDECIDDIIIKKDRIVITYKNLLSEGALDPNGDPVYSYNNLTVCYIRAYEEKPLITYRKKDKLKFLDIDEFENLKKKVIFESVSYSIDSQRRFTLALAVNGGFDSLLYISDIFSEIICEWE